MILFEAFPIFASLLTVIPHIKIQVLQNSVGYFQPRYFLFLKEERPFEPKIVIIISIVGFFTHSGYYCQPVFNCPLFRAQFK